MQGVGYTVEDSAGQSNIFAVEVSHLEGVLGVTHCNTCSEQTKEPLCTQW